MVLSDLANWDRWVARGWVSGVCEEQLSADVLPATPSRRSSYRARCCASISRTRCRASKPTGD